MKKEQLVDEATAFIEELKEAYNASSEEKKAEISTLLLAIIADAREKLRNFVAKPEMLITKESAEKEYNSKVEKLLKMANECRYKTADPGRNSSWVSTPRFFKDKADKFFKVMFVEGENHETGQKWIQALVVRKHNQYDKHSAEKNVGEIVLPVRLGEGEIQVGITAKCPPGSFGKTAFTALRVPVSNEAQIPGFEREKTLWSKSERADSWRMTGKDECSAILVASDKFDTDANKVVWFNLGEVERLINHPNMQDAPTLSLLNWILANRGKIDGIKT